MTISRVGAREGQSGRGDNYMWTLSFPRDSTIWRSNTMGWFSARDSMQQIRLKFDTLDSAVKYCKSQNMNYYVEPDPGLPQDEPKNYASNFDHIPPTPEPLWKARK